MTSEPVQVSDAELRNMPPDEINKARHEGRLTDLLAGRDPGAPPPAEPEPEPPPDNPADLGARGGGPAGQLRDEDLQAMTPEAINEARREGRLDNLLGRR